MPTRFSVARGVASGRRASEDRAEIFERDGELVIVVADGAGGVRGCAQASEALVCAVREHSGARGWSRLLRTVDEDLAGRMAGETTAIVLRVTAGGVTGVSAGDSEAWVVSAAGIDILTSGQHRKRLGSGQCSPFEFRRAALDGVLVVATDGLFNHAMADAVAACCAAGSVDETVARLLALPRLAPGRYPDDVAVVAVVPSERPAAGR